MTSDTVMDCLVDWNGYAFEVQAWGTPKVLVYQSATCNYHNGNSQAGSSRPICGLAALSCARLVFESVKMGLLSGDLLERVLSSAMAKEIMDDLIELGVPQEITISNLFEVPIFKQTFHAEKVHCDLDVLEDFISYWFPDPSSDIRAIVFHNDAETYLCLSLAVAGSDMFALFDSHAHINIARGLSFTVFRDIKFLAVLLRQRLRESPVAIDPFVDLQCNPEMHLSAFVLKPAKPVLQLDAEEPMGGSMSRVQKTKYTARASFNDFLSSPTAISKHHALLRYQSQNPKICPAQCLNGESSSIYTCPSPRGPRSKVVSKIHHGEFGWQLSLQNHVYTVLGDDVDDNDNPKEPGDRNLEVRSCVTGTSSNSRRGDESNWLTSLAVADANNVDMVGHCNDEASITKELSKRKYAWEVELIKQLQDEEEIAATLPKRASSGYTWLVALQKQLQAEESAKSSGYATSSISPLDLDWQLAVQMQHEDDDIPRIVVDSEGDKDVSSKIDSGPSGSNIRNDLLRVPNTDQRDYGDSFIPFKLPALFQCIICGELCEQAQKLSPSECGHSFCKECLTQFTRTKIEEGRYPIFCPECFVERSRTKYQITREILDKLSLTPEEFGRLGELELVSHAVSIECPRCKENMHVDRAEYSQQNVIVCPLPRCANKWCKSCHQTVANSEERHRCRHGNIDRLMKRKGWKYCPGCRTPVQKESGCNHMTCGAPGCNVHFCYKCGVLLIDTTNGGDVGTAVTDHYIQCRLFEKRLRCSIQ